MKQTFLYLLFYQSLVTILLTNIKRFAAAEDYSTLTVIFDDAVALLEGSWSTVSRGGVATGPIVHGSDGTLVADRYRDTVVMYRTLHAKLPDLEYKAPPLPEHRSNIALELDHHIRTGEPLHPTLEVELNLEALAALDAGIRSADSGKMEAVQLQ